MLYLYQSACLSYDAWQGLKRALIAEEEGLVLWDEDDQDRLIEDLLVEEDVSAHPFPERKNTKERGEAFLLLDVPEEKLDPLLQAMRREKVVIPLKAMLTDHNRHMTLADLMEDVADEHALVTELRTLQKLLQATQDFPKQAYSAQAWHSFTESRKKALDFLQQMGQREISFNEAEDHVQSFNQSVLDLMKQRRE